LELIGERGSTPWRCGTLKNTKKGAKINNPRRPKGGRGGPPFSQLPKGAHSKNPKKTGPQPTLGKQKLNRRGPKKGGRKIKRPGNGNREKWAISKKTPGDKNWGTPTAALKKDPPQRGGGFCKKRVWGPPKTRGGPFRRKKARHKGGPREESF